jgi:hypothetical protein
MKARDCRNSSVIETMKSKKITNEQTNKAIICHLFDDQIVKPRINKMEHKATNKQQTNNKQQINNIQMPLFIDRIIASPTQLGGWELGV